MLRDMPALNFNNILKGFFKVITFFGTMFQKFLCFTTLKKIKIPCGVKVQTTPVYEAPLFKYRIRSLRADDIPQVMEKRREMGAPNSKSCLQTWLQLDPEGISVAVHESGEIIGAISHLRYPDNNFVYIGFYFTSLNYRGLGIAPKLCEMAVQHTDDRNAGLHAPPKQVERYKKLMFPLVVWDSICTMNIATENVDSDDLNGDPPPDVSIQPFQESLLCSVCDYDFNLMGYNRERMVELSCKEENSRTFVALKDGLCVGYGSIKLTCCSSKRVGPLYSDEDKVAEALLKTLLDSFPLGRGFAMFTVRGNNFASELMKKLNVPQTNHFPQMYRYKSFEVDTKKVYASFDISATPF